MPLEPPHALWLPGWASSPAVWQPLHAALPGWHHHLPDFRQVRQPADFLPAVAAALPPCALLIGWSLGGQLALAAARQWPERVAGLLLIATPLRFTHPDPALGWPPRVLARMRRRLADDPTATLAAFAAACFTPAEQAAGLAASYAALPADWPPPALDAGLAWLAETDLSAAPAGLAVPWRWVHGEADPICPAAAWAPLRQSTAAPPDRWHLLPAAGHALPWSHPTALAALCQSLVPCR